MHIHKLLLTSLLLTSLSIPSWSQDNRQYVNPFIGTGAHGHTYPGASAPFGAIQLSPDTRKGNWDACSGYHYSDSTLMGFSHTHLSGTGCIDLGDILIRPTREQLADKGKYQPTPFNHKDEYASAGNYQVWLPNEQVNVELTASQYIGSHRYTYKGNKPKYIIIDLDHLLTNEELKQCELKVTSKNEVIGMRKTNGWVNNQTIYFIAHFSQPIAKSSLFGNTIQLEFTSKQATIEVEVALSSTGYQGARKNFEAERTGSFSQSLTKNQKYWDDILSKIQIEGGSREQRQNFYTSLYHAYLSPNVTNDVTGEYLTHQQKVRTLNADEKHYSTLSLWDTFRAWHPLMTLIEGNLTEQIICSMLRMYQDTGELPIWPLASGETRTMIGYHSVSVIADAYLKGIRGFDAELALKAMIKSSNINRKGSNYYTQYGFIPANMRKESVSCLLEYAYDDWCIAQMAKAMGKDDIYQTYIKRSKNYINVFDGATKFFRGKNLSGTWENPFDPLEAGRSYTEATAWQYRFFVPHDTYGLMQLMGGEDVFTSILDSLFDERNAKATTLQDITGTYGQYAHGNEPSHHMAYLYSFTHKHSHKTQELTRTILEKMYQPTPEGISGNEDCGQMSAWYIWSSMGLYPVCPGSNEYILTSPIFTKASIKLSNGKTFTIKSNATDSKKYISEVRLNGKPLNRLYITSDEILSGGILEFTLSEEAQAFDNKDVPYSETKNQVVSIPFIPEDIDLFIDSTTCSLGTATPNAKVYYTLDGSEPTEKSYLYTKPISINQTTVIRAKAYREGYLPSKTLTFTAKRVNPLASTKGEVTAGVRYKYYEGNFKATTELNSALPIKQGITQDISLSLRQRDDKFGLIFEGYILAPEEGIYGFYTKSDDGSMLFIDDHEVVNNEGSHSAIASSGKVALEKGLHHFRLLYFEDYSGEHLSWGWQLPSSMAMTNIPTMYLFH